MCSEIWSGQYQGLGISVSVQSHVTTELLKSALLQSNLYRCIYNYGNNKNNMAFEAMMS